MKKHYIYLAIASLFSIITLGVPQLSGTAFVNNSIDKKPQDALSKIVLQSQLKHKDTKYKIPKNIRVIKISNLDNKNIYNSAVYISMSKDQEITYSDRHKKKITISSEKDTLRIESKVSSLLSIAIDTAIQHLIFDNTKAEAIFKDRLPLQITAENQSAINLWGNKNTLLRTAVAKTGSTLSLHSCFSPTIDVIVENAMVCVDPMNSIDSLKAKLIGKSNIKVKSINENANINFEALKKELNITKTGVNIFVSGNTKYYKKDVDTNEHSH